MEAALVVVGVAPVLLLVGVVSPSAAETLPRRVLSRAQMFRMPLTIEGKSAPDASRKAVWLVCSKLIKAILQLRSTKRDKRLTSRRTEDRLRIAGSKVSNYLLTGICVLTALESIRAGALDDIDESTRIEDDLRSSQYQISLLSLPKFLHNAPSRNWQAQVQPGHNY